MSTSVSLSYNSASLAFSIEFSSWIFRAEPAPDVTDCLLFLKKVLMASHYLYVLL